MASWDVAPLDAFAHYEPAFAGHVGRDGQCIACSPKTQMPEGRRHFRIDDRERIAVVITGTPPDRIGVEHGLRHGKKSNTVTINVK